MKYYRHRVSVVVTHNQQILGFHAEDPNNKKKYFFLPGGLIEEGETIEQAAIRETMEETGYSIEIVEGVRIDSRYDFEWNGRINDCKTHFLLGHLKSETQQVVNDAPYHQGVGWVPLSELETWFGYHEDILKAIRQISLNCPM